MLLYFGVIIGVALLLKIFKKSIKIIICFALVAISVYIAGTIFGVDVIQMLKEVFQ